MGTQKICRLCLKICDGFKALEGDMKDVLNKIVPEINLAVMQDPVMCTSCAEMLIKCYNFKVACCYTLNYVASFTNKDSVKLDLKDVYISKNENRAGIPEDQEICGFCMGSVKSCSAVSLNDGKSDIMLEKMIKQCLPEWDLSIIKEPIICPPCYGSLENWFSFVTNHFVVEEKIKNYRENSDIKSKGQEELSSLLQITIRNTISEGDIIKTEKQISEERENADEKEIGNQRDVLKLETMPCDYSKNAEGECEQKSKIFIDMDFLKYISEEQFTPKDISTCKEESNNDTIKIENDGENALKEGHFLKMEHQEFLHDEKIEIKTDETDFDRLEDDVLSQPGVATGLHKKQNCLNPNLEAGLSEPHVKQLLTNENASAKKTHQCGSCSFKTKYKQSLNVHLLKHKDPSEVTMFKCNCCSFQSRHRNGLRLHLLLHKNPLEVTKYKCDFCSYQTKHKHSLTRHVVIHSLVRKRVTMYKCDICLYETKHKHSLKNHSLIHSQLSKYKCDSCSYQTVHKNHLKTHILVHSQENMYKCASCSFETKYKSYLKKHFLQHKDPSEVTMYKCDSCSFQTNSKDRLKKHLILHRNSEVRKYKCDSCSYQTIHKNNLKTHFLVHSEIMTYKCEFCSFQTKRNKCLKLHLLKHKDPSEVTMYKCNYCSFQTKRKGSLKDHSLTHKDPSELTMHICDRCSFQTKRKGSLKEHLLTHKDPSEITMYKCDSCSYQTKRKHYLKYHEVTHKNSLE